MLEKEDGFLGWGWVGSGAILSLLVFIEDNETLHVSKAVVRFIRLGGTKIGMVLYSYKRGDLLYYM